MAYNLLFSIVEIVQSLIPNVNSMAAHYKNKGHHMKKSDKIRPFKKNDDLLDEIMKKKDPEDLGLLDLILVEEMIDQKKRKNGN